MKGPDSLNFSTAGIPLSANPRNTEEGIKTVRKLGLGGMELEFVRSVNISKKKAPHIKELAKKENVFLTCHGQYWINLNAQDAIKARKSIGMILDASRRAYDSGAWSICYHMAYMMKQPMPNVYATVKQRAKEVLE